MWFCVRAEGDRGTIRIAEFCPDHLPESITTCGGEWRCADVHLPVCAEERVQEYSLVLSIDTILLPA